jgi:hypothetical protein
MALPPGFDRNAHRAHDRVSRPPERSNWRRHGPYLRTLAVALVLTAAAASAGMLMALMGDCASRLDHCSLSFVDFKRLLCSGA